MKVVSIWRSRSGLAWASCSCRKWAGSILEGAVIASNSWVCGRSPEDHAVAASTFRARYSPGRRTPPWWTPLHGVRPRSTEEDEGPSIHLAPFYLLENRVRDLA